MRGTNTRTEINIDNKKLIYFYNQQPYQYLESSYEKRRWKLGFHGKFVMLGKA